MFCTACLLRITDTLAFFPIKTEMLRLSRQVLCSDKIKKIRGESHRAMLWLYLFLSASRPTSFPVTRLSPYQIARSWSLFKGLRQRNQACYPIRKLPAGDGSRRGLWYRINFCVRWQVGDFIFQFHSPPKEAAGGQRRLVGSDGWKEKLFLPLCLGKTRWSGDLGEMAPQTSSVFHRLHSTVISWAFSTVSFELGHISTQSHKLACPQNSHPEVQRKCG